ncbi:MAG TPA: Spy/CpxP family protein refolding chaperone [Dongiaceae bacterium]|nr:Spy/CpxP family protein refolding chaperone [Dongiaceae bacterium]
MKNAKWFAIGAAAVISAAASSPTLAQSGDGQRPPAWAQMFERIRERLGLTDDQVAQIKAQLQPEPEPLKDLLLRLHEAKGALRRSIHSSDATEAAIRSVAAKVGEVEADLAIERHKLYGKVSAILTAEQREQITEFQEKLDDLLDTAIERLSQRVGVKTAR